MEFDKAHRNEIPAIDIFLLMKENIYNYQKDKNVIKHYNYFYEFKNYFKNRKF